MQSFWSVGKTKDHVFTLKLSVSSQDCGRLKETAEVGWRRGCRGRRVPSGRGSRSTTCVLTAHHRLHTDHICGSYSIRVLKERVTAERGHEAQGGLFILRSSFEDPGGRLALLAEPSPWAGVVEGPGGPEGPSLPDRASQGSVYPGEVCRLMATPLSGRTIAPAQQEPSCHPHDLSSCLPSLH